jgi:hypothetical protein
MFCRPIWGVAFIAYSGVNAFNHAMAAQSSELIGRIKGGFVCRMSTKLLSANQLAALSALVATPTTKAKASITLSAIF